MTGGFCRIPEGGDAFDFVFVSPPSRHPPTLIMHSIKHRRRLKLPQQLQ